MANDLTALGDFHLDELQKASSWAPFQMGFIEEDSLWVDNLVADLDIQQTDLNSSKTKATSEDTPNYDRAPSTNAEQRRPGGDVSLDMNNPAVLGDYGSLLLFANNPFADHLELEDCDSSKQVTIQSLAAKLDLQYFFDAPLGVIRLRKKTYRAGFGQHSEQPRAAPEPTMPFKGQMSSPSPRSKSRYLTEAYRSGFPTAAVSSPPSIHDGVVAMDLDSTYNDLDFGQPQESHFAEQETFTLEDSSPTIQPPHSIKAYRKTKT
ncbi:hypothetical protein Hte_008814 [Hypoxylon texense]